MLSREERGAKIKEGQARSNKTTGRPKKDTSELKKQTSIVTGKHNILIF